MDIYVHLYPEGFPNLLLWEEKDATHVKTQNLTEGSSKSQLTNI